MLVKIPRKKLFSGPSVLVPQRARRVSKHPIGTRLFPPHSPPSRAAALTRDTNEASSGSQEVPGSSGPAPSAISSTMSGRDAPRGGASDASTRTRSAAADLHRVRVGIGGIFIRGARKYGGGSWAGPAAHLHRTCAEEKGHAGWTRAVLPAQIDRGQQAMSGAPRSFTLV